MNREIVEVHDFTREEVETILKNTAKRKISGSIYYGDFTGQTIQEHNGGYRVITHRRPQNK